MFINDDNDKLRRSPSTLPTSSSRSRSPTTSLPPSAGYTPGRRSSYNSNRWSSADRNDRASPTAYSNSGRRSSDTGSIHSRGNSGPLHYVHLGDDPHLQYNHFDEDQYPYSQPPPHSYPRRHHYPPLRSASNGDGYNGNIGRSHGSSLRYQPYNRNNRSVLGYVHVNDDPHLQYNRFDEDQNTYSQRTQPPPHSTRLLYTHTNYPRRRQTQDIAPQYPPLCPASSGDNGNFGDPPASVRPSNGILIDRDNDGISGWYIVDPDSPCVAPDQENLNLSSKNGGIDVDVAVLPARSTSANADRATIKFQSKCAAVKLRLHDAPKRFFPNNGIGSFTPRTMIVDVESKNGLADLCIPRSYKGILDLHTANGKIKLSPSVRATMTTLDSNDQRGDTREFGVMGHFNGLRDIQDALAAERVADAADQAEASYSVPNLSQLSGPRVAKVMAPDGATTYCSGGGSVMFNGVSNVSILGGEFRNTGGSACACVIVNGQPVIHSGPYQPTSNFVRTPPQKLEQLSTILKTFKFGFKGSKITVLNKHGSVKVCFDDETMEAHPGGWKGNNEDTPSNPRRANPYFDHMRKRGYTSTFTGMGIPFMNIGDSTPFSWFG